jgi:hypothetical protein
MDVLLFMTVSVYSINLNIYGTNCRLIFTDTLCIDVRQNATNRSMTLVRSNRLISFTYKRFTTAAHLLVL